MGEPSEHDDPLWERVAEVREECGDDPLAADIAEALVRNAGMSYLDMTSPEEAAHIAARVAREHLAVPLAVDEFVNEADSTREPWEFFDGD